ncbi:MAG TPA: MBL fold metallo-hydrolase [Polyangia bacterium]|nr:MBL fold metallo-hydrolase [Polyangia bacterium]
MRREDELERAHLERRHALDEAHRRRGFRRAWFLGMWARQMVRPPRPAVRAPLPPVARGQLGVTFVGHSTVLLRYHDARILTDPNLGRWLLGLRRAWEPGLEPAQLTSLDLVLVSHAHHDHLVRPSLRKIASGATCVVPPRCADLVDDLGFARVVELPLGESFRLGTVEVTAVPARHWGLRLLGDYKRRGYGGYVVCGDGPSAYFAGDTAYFSGFAEIGRRFRPHVALLPIGAYQPPSFRRSHMSPLDAIYAFEDLGARLLIPIHFGSYPLSYEPLDDPPAWLRELARTRRLEQEVRILGNGESQLLEL